MEEKHSGTDLRTKLIFFLSKWKTKSLTQVKITFTEAQPKQNRE